jgi:SAM-dependent methyltransferase
VDTATCRSTGERQRRSGVTAPPVAWHGAAGTPLHADTAITPNSGTLHDGERRWPVVHGIPWLRAGRDDVREQAVTALDAGDPEGAAVILLADADDWWDAPPPPDAQLRAALQATSLRDAVDLLGFGRVGTYFVHRWSDPSWLAALALTAAHPPAGRPVVDLACGAGHLLRHLALHGHRDLTGVDVVFAKLWLARRFVLPVEAPVALVCADLTAAWPLPEPRAPRHIACHDALYFLPEKETFVAAARRHAGDGGAVLLGHCHNSLHPAGRAGLPLDPEGWQALLPGAAAYAEEELTAATADGRLPVLATVAELAATEALGLALDTGAVTSDPALLGPAPGAALRRNPLYAEGVRRWPQERWAAEYGPRAAAYLPERWTDLPAGSAVRRRLLLDLPEAW